MIKELSYDTHEGAEFKRFVMFASHHYYPCGGFEDAKVTADTLAEVLHWHVEQGSRFDYNEWHIFDCKEMKIVKKG